MERRKLIGRRYEDFLRGGISIDLSPEESLVRMVIQDPRYNPLLERRRGPRRMSDQLPLSFPSIFDSQNNFQYIPEIKFLSPIIDEEFTY